MEDTKNDELPGYSQDEISFLKKVVTNVRQRKDRMIELPLPFKDLRPNFPFNRSLAYKRTKQTLERMKVKNPDVFQSSLDKFAKNLNLENPRFVPVPKKFRHKYNGKEYWIPLFSVWQKEKASTTTIQSKGNKAISTQ